MQGTASFIIVSTIPTRYHQQIINSKIGEKLKLNKTRPLGYSGECTIHPATKYSALVEGIFGATTTLGSMMYLFSTLPQESGIKAMVGFSGIALGTLLVLDAGVRYETVDDFSNPAAKISCAPFILDYFDETIRGIYSKIKKHK